MSSPGPSGVETPSPNRPQPPSQAVPAAAALSARLVNRFSSTFRSLRHRNYRLFCLGQIVSLVGSWMQTTALMWLAFDLTRQSRWPALISAAQMLPTFFLGTLGGALVDRWPKRSVLLATQAALLLQALALAGLVFGGVVEPGLLVGITLVSGLIQAVDL